MATLLEIPAELRNRIYRYILIKDEPISVQAQADRREEHQALAITRINKQVRREASDIYYACNHFRFSYYDCDCDPSGARYERHFARELYDSALAKNGHIHFGETMSKYLPQWCLAVGADNFEEVRKLSLEGFCSSRSACRACFIRVDVDIKERTVRRHGAQKMTPGCKQGPQEADKNVRMINCLLAQPAEWLSSGFGRASMGKSLVTCFRWAQAEGT